MKKNPQMPSARRILGMVVGIVIIGLGIALFKQSHLGNDSISALNMRLAEMQNLCTNILFFALQFWFGRKYIGLGTFVNGIGVGFIVTAFSRPHCSPLWPGRGAGPAGAAAVGGAGGASHGAGGFAVPDGRSGHRPRTITSRWACGTTPRCRTFGCRVFTDALLCWLLGGLVGIGTLICAFCLGPFIQFFNGLVSERCCTTSRAASKIIKKACTSFAEVHAFCCAEIRT